MIVIINYGLGNVLALLNVYRRLNIHCWCYGCGSRSSYTPYSAWKRAFDQAIQLLQSSEMREKGHELVLSRKMPVLGVGVGMQILGESSEEGGLPGLRWIDGCAHRDSVYAFHTWDGTMSCLWDNQDYLPA